MENASEALMMAFGVLIFVLALTVAMNSFNQVKSTSDVVLYRDDETNYYDYQGATGAASQNRIVGLETIIPTLYKYYKENYTVVFREGNYDEATGKFSNLQPLYVYTTKSSYKTKNGRSYLWGKEDGTQSTYDTLLIEKYKPYFTNFETNYTKGNQKIFTFDLEEETLRHEPWTGSYNYSKNNLDCLLNGDTYYNPSNNTEYIKYGDSGQVGIGGFTEKYRKSRFVETVGEYSYSNEKISDDTDTTDEEYELEINSSNSRKKKRIVIFTLLR